MARRLKTDADIDAFVAKVISEAEHHASDVDEVIQPLSDEVRKRLNLALDKVAVYERKGELARTCWVTIQGQRYVFSYNYAAKTIDLRDSSTQGPHRFSFDNATTPATISTEIGKL
jgi:hypothetical protein